MLYVFIKRSRPGRALRAVVEDFEIASIQGIRSRIYYPLGFGIGVGLAAVAGALMAPLFSVSPFVGAAPLLKAFIVVILGGLGSIPGDRKSTRLLQSLMRISYAVFCLKKKKNKSGDST